MSAMHGLTDQQAKVLRILAEFGDRGAMCWQIRDRLYPADSKMRVYRTHGSRGGGSRAGAAGALGNLAVGRICSALADKHLVRRGKTTRSGSDFRYYLTETGRRRLGLGPDTTTLDLEGT